MQDTHGATVLVSLVARMPMRNYPYLILYCCLMPHLQIVAVLGAAAVAYAASGHAVASAVVGVLFFVSLMSVLLLPAPVRALVLQVVALATFVAVYKLVAVATVGVTCTLVVCAPLLLLMI
jgi:hypothetical protein